MITYFCFDRMPISLVNSFNARFMRLKLTSIVKNKSPNFV